MDQMRARIRASVYQALLSSAGPGGAGQDGPRSAPPALVSIVADFLQKAELDMTRQVFLREAGVPQAGRDELVMRIESWIGPSDRDRSLLDQIVAAARRRHPDSLPASRQ